MDPSISMDPETDSGAGKLPRNLLFAEAGSGVKAATNSALIGKAKHLYCELLISMHHTGLQKGRYDSGLGSAGGREPGGERRDAREAARPAAPDCRGAVQRLE